MNARTIHQLFLSTVLVFTAAQAFASPNTNCREEALASGQQAVESRFEGNERIEGDGNLTVQSSKDESGYQAIVTGKSMDYHRGGEAAPEYVTKVTLVFDKDCGEVSRIISKKFIRN